MSRTMTIILILLAIFLILGMVNKNKEANGKKTQTQDELLNSMSDEDLFLQAKRVVPVGFYFPEMKKPFSLGSRQALIDLIKQYSNG